MRVPSFKILRWGVAVQSQSRLTRAFSKSLRQPLQNLIVIPAQAGGPIGKICEIEKVLAAATPSCSSASTAEWTKPPKDGALSEEPQYYTSFGAGSKSTRSIGSPTSGQMTSLGRAIIRTSF